MEDILRDFIHGKSMEKLYTDSVRQGISALVWSVIYDTDDIPEEVRDGFIRQTKRTMLQGDRLIFDTVREVRMMEACGIRCAVLKGVAMGSYYPSPVLRRAGDIDIYVPDPSDHDRASQILADAGFIQEDRSYSLHHVGYTGSDGIETELHSMLLEPFDDTGVNELISHFEKNISLIRREVRPGISIPMLSERDNAIYLMLHLLSHFLGEGMSLRQMVDLTVLFNGMTDDSDRSYFSDFMINAGLRTFAVSVLGYCVRYLGLEPSHNPMAEWDDTYDESLESRIADALAGGDFGHHGAERMAVPADATAKGLAATFITQVKRQYPAQWTHLILRPFLCVRTLAGFIRNNRKVRHVSTLSVLRDAVSRGRNAGAMKIFHDDTSFHVRATGNSMWPFIHDGDEVSIRSRRAGEKLHRYDIVLYRRDNGMKVLHRIIRIREDGYYMAGDNQVETEGPVPEESIIGVLEGFYRGSRFVKGSFIAGRIWALIGPLRRIYRRIKDAVKR